MSLRETIETGLKLEDIHYYEKTENTFQKAFVSLQCNCALCASNLEIKIIASDIVNEIREEAHCPQCKIRLRSKSHSLQ